MSTNNFAYENCLQVVEIEDDFDYECALENVKSQLTHDFPKGDLCDVYLNDGLSRSYGGKIIFQIPIAAKGGEYPCSVDVIVRSGYYSGANFDWVITEDDNYDLPDKDKYRARAERTGALVTRSLKKVTTSLLHVATFSNGEAVYKLAKR